MISAKEAQIIINQSLNKINWDLSPLGLYVPIAYFLGEGGKRVRPVLGLLAADLFDADYSSVINPMIGIEIFHNFSLLHDDLMDKAEMRRNKPTVHIKWDENTALLSGDAMLVKSYQYIAQAPDYSLQEVFDIFSQTALEVCEGQQYDMDFEKLETVSANEYLEMIRLKTAVLLAASMKIAAIIGKASAEDAQLLYDFGINIGLAFQLKDDLLDVYGDSEIFGKKIGGDILCNKKTFLLIKAREKASLEIKERLDGWMYKGRFLPNEKITAITAIYDELGVKELCEQKIDYYFDAAVRCLDKVSVDNSCKTVLRNFTEELMTRVS